MAGKLKNAMRYLGLAEEQAENETAAMPVLRESAQPQPLAAPKAAPQVTELRRVTPVAPAASAPMTEILTLHPRKYADVPQIAENFREGIPVVLNLTALPDADARRIIDFATGLSMGLNGHFERITTKVFLLTPAHVAIAGAHEAQQVNDSGSFFVQPEQ